MSPICARASSTPNQASGARYHTTVTLTLEGRMKSPQALGTVSSGVWGKLPKDKEGRKGLGTGAPRCFSSQDPSPPTELQIPCSFRLSLDRGCGCRSTALFCHSLSLLTWSSLSHPLPAPASGWALIPPNTGNHVSHPASWNCTLFAFLGNFMLHSPQPSQTSPLEQLPWSPKFRITPREEDWLRGSFPSTQDANRWALSKVEECPEAAFHGKCSKNKQRQSLGWILDPAAALEDVHEYLVCLFVVFLSSCE